MLQWKTSTFLAMTVLCGALVLAQPASSNAQASDFSSASVTCEQKRVKFPPGRTTVVLQGKTTGGPSESGGMNPVSYVLGARKGQTMTLHLTSAKKNAVFGVYAPGTELTEGAQSVTDWSGTLPKTGDYEIIVFPEDEKTNTTFTLEITIR